MSCLGSLVLEHWPIVSSPSLQEILCCLGQPVAGNPTQYLMEKAVAKAGLDWRYLTLEVDPDDLGDAVRGMRAMGFRGGNFATPHQTAVVEHLDQLSESARLVGAVNCVCREGDALVGSHTTGQAFLTALRKLTDPAEKKIVILGAGEAARAIAIELGKAGCAEVVVVSQTPDHGQALVELLAGQLDTTATSVVLEGDYAVPGDAHVVVNATSVGMGNSADQAPLAVETLEAHQMVADLVFQPPRTQLLHEAQQRDCQTIDGLAVFVAQAAIAFRMWTDIDADTVLMREALEEFLGF